MSAMPDSENIHEVVIIGAGLAGLSCAKRICDRASGSSGSPPLKMAVLEASDRVGGRVRTDTIDGLTLDHGFQVLLTAYPACQELLDYSSLQLRPFEPGALVRHQGGFARLGDPWRRPTQAIATALSGVGSLGDKLKIATIRSQSNKGSLNDLYERPAEATLQRLRSTGFSDAMIDQFFRPFLGGVFLDESLATSSRMLEFVFRMFAAGDIAVPAQGMAAIPRQLADSLPRGTLRLKSAVARLEHQTDCTIVHLTDGDRVTAKRVVIATESNAAARLLEVPELETKWNQTTNLYYSAKTSPDKRKTLMLRGDETGPVQTAVVLSDVAPEYASRDRALISVSASESDVDADTETLDKGIRGQLKDWFGNSVNDWELVQTYRVPYALPHSSLEPVLLPVQASQLADSAAAHSETDRPIHRDQVFVCGDHRETPSIQGAMNSGLRVADLIKRQVGEAE